MGFDSDIQQVFQRWARCNQFLTVTPRQFLGLACSSNLFMHCNYLFDGQPNPVDGEMGYHDSLNKRIVVKEGRANDNLWQWSCGCCVRQTSKDGKPLVETTVCVEHYDNLKSELERCKKQKDCAALVIRLHGGLPE